MAFCDLFRKNILDDAAVKSAGIRAGHVKTLGKLMKKVAGIELLPEYVIYESRHDPDFPNAAFCGMFFFVRHRDRQSGAAKPFDELIAYKYFCQHDKEPTSKRMGSVIKRSCPNGYHQKCEDGKFRVYKEVTVNRPADLKPLLDAA